MLGVHLTWPNKHLRCFLPEAEGSLLVQDLSFPANRSLTGNYRNIKQIWQKGVS